MSEIRVKISSASIPETTLFPGWGKRIDFDLTRQEDQIFFLTEFPEMQFKGANYTLLKTAAGCEEITVNVQERCGGEWVTRHTGTFTDYDEKTNENQCWATVKPKTKDDYQCIFDKWESENVVYGPEAVTQVSALIGEYQHGAGLCCTVCFDATPPGPVCDVPDDWCFDQNIDLGEHPSCEDGEHRWRSCFHRLVGQGTPTTPPPYGTGWLHLTGNDWWRCPSQAELAGGVFGHGKLFSDVIQNLVSQMVCDITVRSHFFDINATHTAPPDEAAAAYEYATTFLHHLTVHQKSDIKRPFSDTPAESIQWKMTLKKLLEDLRFMFNVYWKMDGSDLILEHYTYFPAGDGLDLSVRNLKLEYGKSEAAQAPKREHFYWMDRAAFSLPFKGYNITYDCGGAGKERQVQLFSTDVVFISNDENAESVADTGFVLIANEIVDGNSYMMDSNKPLGWAMLHENLHRDYRYFEQGTLNNAETTFNSVRKTRALAPFQVTLCCDDEFNPEQDIITSIGNASPEKVTINYASGKDSRTLTINANI
jgi:hypothetical protein